MIPSALAAALKSRGYDVLTPVQDAVLDPALDGADMLVSAQTGSGKTVGFGLALGSTLLDGADKFGAAAAPLALIIAPTRELAMQVKRELDWLYAEAGVRMASCVGGMDMRDERRALERGAHIVVATPGRLRDHIMRGSINLSAIRAVVLDEADEMLDLGFREDLEFILGKAPESRRTLLFSATVSKPIADLARNYQRDAQRVVVKSETRQHSDIHYNAMMVAPQDVENAIINILRFYEAPNAIVFCNTRAMVNRITTRLSNRGFAVVALSGELSQAERSHALQAMRDGRARVCVATDVAARGIDLPGLDLVIHADLPGSHETLLHRSGRTGRAGRKGVSCLIVPSKVRRKAERILREAKLDADWGPAPSAAAIYLQDESRLMQDPVWTTAAEENEVEMVQKLLQNFTAEAIATAYTRAYRARISAPEELSDINDKAPDGPRDFGPSAWFQLNQGRKQGTEVRRLLPILCDGLGITKDDIGAIRLNGDDSAIEFSTRVLDRVREVIAEEDALENGLRLTPMDAPPPRAARGKPVFGGKKPHRGHDRTEDRPRSKPKSAPRDGNPKQRARKFDDDAIFGGDMLPPPPAKKRAKPAGESEGHSAKPRFKPAAKQGKPDWPAKPGKPADRKPGSKPTAAGAKPHTGGAKPSSPKTGKPNSKKNKARRAAPPAGMQPPTRRK